MCTCITPKTFQFFLVLSSISKFFNTPPEIFVLFECERCNFPYNPSSNNTKYDDQGFLETSMDLSVSMINDIILHDC